MMKGLKMYDVLMAVRTTVTLCQYFIPNSVIITAFCAKFAGPCSEKAV